MHIRTQQDCAILQEDLNKLVAWGQKWGRLFTWTSAAQSGYPDQEIPLQKN